MKTGFKVKDAMVSPVLTGKPDQTILEASRIMRKNGVGSLIIIEDGKPSGIITREDIINKVTSEDKIASKILVRDVQSQNLVTCIPETEISEAAKIMSKHKYERIPVVSDGNLVGIISAREIAKVAPSLLEIATEHLRINNENPINNEENSGECQACGNYSESLNYSEDKWICDSCKED